MQRDEAYLLDMLLSARDALSVVGQLTREQFQNSLIHQLASFKAIETIRMPLCANVTPPKRRANRLTRSLPNPT